MADRISSSAMIGDFFRQPYGSWVFGRDVHSIHQRQKDTVESWPWFIWKLRMKYFRNTMGCCEFFLTFFSWDPDFNISLQWSSYPVVLKKNQPILVQLWTSPLKTISGSEQKISPCCRAVSVRMRWKQRWKNTRISFSVRACSGNWCHSGRPWLDPPQHCRGTPLLTTIHRFFSFSGGTDGSILGCSFFGDWNREAPWVAGARSSPEIWQIDDMVFAQNRLLYPQCAVEPHFSTFNLQNLGLVRNQMKTNKEPRLFFPVKKKGHV